MCSPGRVAGVKTLAALKTVLALALLALSAACGGGGAPQAISSATASAGTATATPAATTRATRSAGVATPTRTASPAPPSSTSPAPVPASTVPRATRTPAPRSTTSAPKPTATRPQPSAGPTTALTIRNFMFSPSSLTVPVGTTVRATNDDGASHTWTSSGHWDSGNLDTGQSFSFRFTTKGVFSFVCSYHATMTGKVTVS